MKLKNIFKKFEGILDSEEQSRKSKRKHLEHVLNKLRKFERETTARLKLETDESTKKHLKKKIALSHAQRKKGVRVLQKLKAKN